MFPEKKLLLLLSDEKMIVELVCSRMCLIGESEYSVMISLWIAFNMFFDLAQSKVLLYGRIILMDLAMLVCVSLLMLSRSRSVLGILFTLFRQTLSRLLEYPLRVNDLIVFLANC